MSALHAPSAELAGRLLAELDFDERLIGFRLHRRMGPQEIPLFSFAEAVGLLARHAGEAYIDLRDLEAWMRDIMGDHELANRIREFSNQEGADMPKLLAVTELMVGRLVQCIEAGKPEPVS